MSLFGSMNTAKTALHTNEQALAITGHNIANANTPGYTRQTADIAALPLEVPNPANAPASALLGGVTVAGVQRIRDQFADNEYRADVGDQGMKQMLSNTMDHVEALLNEPSDSGLQASMSKFFQSFSDLSNNPESGATRAAVRQAGTALAGTIQHLWQGLGAAAQSADAQLAARAQEVNSDAAQIAALNVRVAQAQGQNSSAGDLLDQRDQLLDRLARLAGARAVVTANGTVNVTLGGRLLVGPAGANPITVAAGAASITNLTWADGSTVNITGGEIAGLQQGRDQVAGGLETSLTTLTNTLVTAVNSVHAAGTGLAGSTGVNFFDAASTPATIRLDSTVAGNANAIAASASGAPGDGSNAQKLSQLTGQPLVSGSTIPAFYQGVVGSLGIQARQTQKDLQATNLLVQQADSLRQSTGGVSLDEEATNMVRYQRSYQAAAKFVTTINDLLDTLIRM